MLGSWNFFILLPKNLSIKVIEKSRRAKSETLWFRRNRTSEPKTWPTKSRWKDMRIERPRHQTRAGRVLYQQTWKFPIFSTWFGWSCSGLGCSISRPQPRRFRLWPSGFRNNFSRQILWYPTKKKFRHPCIRPILCPRRQSRAGRVLRPRKWKFPIFSTWFGGSMDQMQGSENFF
jgi:hypothetical protein